MGAKLTETACYDGFVIANREWSPELQLEMGISSLAYSAVAAWSRHLGIEKAASNDRPIYIQRWSDKGYGPIPVRVTIRTPAGRSSLTGGQDDE